MEESLHDGPLHREFAELDTVVSWLRDESIVLRLRHLLEKQEFSAELLVPINATLAKRGLLLKTGTVVDATLIGAPSSTKNSKGERDLEMHQVKEGNQCCVLRTSISIDSALTDGGRSNPKSARDGFYSFANWCCRP